MDHELFLVVGESHTEEPRNLGSSQSHLLRSSRSLAWSSQPLPGRESPRESPSPWHEIHNGVKQSQITHTATCAPTWAGEAQRSFNMHPPHLSQLSAGTPDSSSTGCIRQCGHLTSTKGETGTAGPNQGDCFGDRRGTGHIFPEAAAW